MLIGKILKDIEFINEPFFWFDAGISFKSIFCEFMLENIFYRKDSNCISYKPERGDKIESQNIPVYSFRYKSAFNKSEEKEYS